MHSEYKWKLIENESSPDENVPTAKGWVYIGAGASTMLLVKVPPRDRCILLPSFLYSSRMHLPRAKIRRVIRDAYRRKIVRCFPIRETCESLIRLLTPWNVHTSDTSLESGLLKRILTKVCSYKNVERV